MANLTGYGAFRLLLPRKLVIALVPLLLFCSELHGASPFPILWSRSSQSTDFLQGDSLQILEDPPGKLTLKEVLLSPKFSPTSDTFSNFGFTTSAYWVRVGLTNETSHSQTLYLTLPNPFYDTVDVYHVDETGSLLKHWFTGDLQPFSSRPVSTTGYAFPLQFPASTTSLAYVRVTNSEVFWLGVRMETVTDFSRVERPRYVTLGLLYGIILIMVIYNLMLFFIIKEPNYLLYSVYLFLHGLFLASFRGIAYEFLWPSSPGWHGVTNTVLPCLLLAALLGFVRRYLNTQEEMPRSDQISIRAILVAILAIPFLLLLDRHVSNEVVSVGSFLGLVWVCFVTLRAQFLGVRFATVLNTAFGSLVLTYAFLAMLIFPPPGADPPTWIMDYFRNVGLEFAVCLEATILSLGVGYRINILRTEANALAQTNLELQSKARQKLEQEVEQQTVALRKALNELEQTQNTLISQARMATLGNLASGVAHEIRNPLNVTLGGASTIAEVLGELDSDVINALGSHHKTLETCASLIGRGSQRIEDIVLKLNQLTEESERIPGAVCHLHKAAATTLQLLKSSLVDRNIEARVNIPKDLVAPINTGELSQVLLNLTLNAVEAVERRGTIEFLGAEEEDQIVLRVMDSGPGVAPSIRDTVFDAFFTTKPQGEGSGLGLAMSRKMVTDAGGELTLLGTGKGAVFEIRF